MKPEPLVVIVGPTASGKTALGIEIAKRHNGEIICADSRTVYKGLDIGTAKPTQEEQQQIKHHLLDVVEPNETFTAADFKRLANAAIQDIYSRGKLPVMVGGTGLYVDSVIFDYEFGEPADPTYRSQLNKLSTEELQGICSEKGIELPFNSRNKRHLIRAIELGGLKKHDAQKLRPNTLVVGITIDREKLREKMTKRVRVMFRQGIVAEATRMAAKYGWEAEGMTGDIYRVVHSMLKNDQSEQEAIEECSRRDMRLAKRQMTWFKRNPYIFWSDDSQQLITKIDQFITSLKA